MSSNVWTTRTSPAGTAHTGSQWSPSNKTPTIWWPYVLTCWFWRHHFSVRIWPTWSQLRKLRQSNTNTTGKGRSSGGGLSLRLVTRVCKWKRTSSSPMALPCSAKRSIRWSGVMQTCEPKSTPGCKAGSAAEAGSQCAKLVGLWSPSDGHECSEASSSPEPHTHGLLTSELDDRAATSSSRNRPWKSQNAEYLTTRGNSPRRKPMKLRETAP